MWRGYSTALAVCACTCACAVSLAGIVAAAPSGPNDAPVIGILTLPIDQCDSYISKTPTWFVVGKAGATAGSCFTWFYVKWLEMAGARVVPIPYDANATVITSLLSSVNGVLFTGGGLNLTPNTTYYQTAQLIFNTTIAANAKGVYFPLWGTCQGFQLLCVLAAGTDVLEHNAFDSEDYSIPLNLTVDGLVSRLFGPMPVDIVQILAKEPVTTNLHHDGVTPDTFAAKVSPLFTSLSTNLDRNGKAFVSTMEAKQFPIWGTQWHPERNQFEWDASMNINHSSSAIRAMQYMGNFFVDQARLNQNQFPSQASLSSALIYNFQPSAGSTSYELYTFPF